MPIVKVWNGQRTTQVDAVVVLLVRGTGIQSITRADGRWRRGTLEANGEVTLVEVCIGIQIVIAKDVVHGAVILVRARFGHETLHAASRASELRRGDERDQFELLDGFDRRSFLIVERGILGTDLIQTVKQDRSSLVLRTSNLDLPYAVAAGGRRLCSRARRFWL
jgi:hypothetical protein